MSGIQEQYKMVVSAIDQRRLKDAIDLLHSMVRKAQQSKLIDDLYNIETAYRSMLRYNLEGAVDPQRDQVYLHIVSDLYAIADTATGVLLSQHTNLLVYSIKKQTQEKTLSQMMTDYESSLDAQELRSLTGENSENMESYNTLLQIFNHLWSCDLNNDYEQLIINLFHSTKVPWQAKAFLVSAIWLSMANQFCLTRAGIIIRLCTHTHPPVSSRARVALLLSLFQHGNRWKISTTLRDRLTTLMEQKNMNELIFQVLINIVRTRQTDRIARTMQDEIFPEILKKGSSLREKFDLDKLLGEAHEEGKNPEWEDIFSDRPELMSKLEEVGKWQMEGEDVFMSTFKSLKQFPFFTTPANWFMPFYNEQPLLAEALRHENDLFRNSDLIKKLSESTMLCNSDKYSLMLGIPMVPPAQKEMMTSMYGAELNQMNELQENETQTSPLKHEGSLANQYIQDLYRFFKVFPRKNEFEDIFNRIFDLQNRWFFTLVVPDRSRMIQLAEFFFTRNYYTDAISIYQLLQKEETDDVAIIQKIAYCHQQNNDWEQALKHYLHADLLTDNNHWITKKVALCYLKTEQTQKALEYYLKAEKLQPNKIHTKVSIANCYLELKESEQALKYFFEVEYIETNNHHVWRPIAWCSFVQKKYDQAERYYLKTIDREEKKHDLLSLAHVYWCSGRRKDAVEMYSRAYKLFANDQEFKSSFDADTPYLIDNGVTLSDLPIMLDQIRYLAH